jgi:hypothetical protein
LVASHSRAIIPSSGMAAVSNDLNTFSSLMCPGMDFTRCVGPFKAAERIGQMLGDEEFALRDARRVMREVDRTGHA